VEELRAAGFTAYLVQPTRTVPDALYRVRIGFFETREEAEQKVRALEQRLGTKLWVIRER
jgi:cell division septation protein DedD